MRHNSPKKRPPALLVALACSLPPIVAGCAASHTPAIAIGAPLPVAPTTFGAPVAVPEPARREDARGYAARALGALGQANARLRYDASFYDDVRRAFGAGR